MHPIMSCGQCRTQVIPLDSGRCPACGGDPAVVTPRVPPTPARVSGRYLVHALLWFVIGGCTLALGQVAQQEGWRHGLALILPWFCFVGGAGIVFYALLLRSRGR